MPKTLITTSFVDEIPVLTVSTDDTHRKPVIVHIPGYGGNKEDGIPFGYFAAQMGFLWISFDPLYHGERYNPILDRAFEPEFGGLYPPESGLDIGRVFYQVIHHCLEDVMRILDHFSKDPYADVQSCGVTGHSMGGYATYLLLANMDVVRAGVAMNGVPTFSRRWTDILDESRFSNSDWQKSLNENNEASQSLIQFIRAMDPAEKLKSSFPKALLLMNNDFDTDQPKIYAVDMYRELSPSYASAPDRLKLNIYPGGHKVSNQMMRDALEWFRLFLKA